LEKKFINSNRYISFKILSIWHTRCREIKRVYFVYRVYRSNNQARMVLNKTSQKGLKNGWTRATFILRKDYLEKLKSLSYWERKKIKEVIDEALRSYLKGKKIRNRMNR
jgi:hypothetical protein